MASAAGLGALGSQDSGRQDTQWALERMFQVDPKEWRVTLNPPLKRPSTFVLAAGEGNQLTSAPLAHTRLTSSFNQPDDTYPGAPVITERDVEILAPLYPANKPTITVKTDGPPIVKEIALEAYRYDEYGRRLMGEDIGVNVYGSRPVLVSPVELERESGMVLRQVLNTTQEVFRPFKGLWNSGRGAFDTYVVPGSNQVHTGADGDVIFLGLKTITEPAYEQQAEIETFAATSEAVFSSQFEAMNLKPATAELVTKVTSQWKGVRADSVGKRDLSAIEKLFAKGTYTGGAVLGGDSAHFADSYNYNASNTRLFADALTIMRFFPSQLARGVEALPTELDKSIARDRLNATLLVLADGYNYPDKHILLGHLKSLIYNIQPLEERLGLIPVSKSNQDNLSLNQTRHHPTA